MDFTCFVVVVVLMVDSGEGSQRVLVTDSVSCANSPCNTDTFPSNPFLEA